MQRTACHASNWNQSLPESEQKEIVDFCQEKGITVTAYSPLGSPDRPWFVEYFSLYYVIGIFIFGLRKVFAWFEHGDNHVSCLIMSPVDSSVAFLKWCCSNPNLFSLACLNIHRNFNTIGQRMVNLFCLRTQNLLQLLRGWTKQLPRLWWSICCNGASS